MIRIIFKGMGISVALLTGIFILGPRPSFGDVNNLPSAQRFIISDLDEMLHIRESEVENLKKDNEARIVWADSIPTKTKYSLVYLHGFTASQGEGFPLHLNIADSIHANLYLTRLPDHGINNKDIMKNLTPEQLVESSKEAVAIGKSIGEKVILMGCSTGGTLAIYLAAGDQDIEGLILLSPNIQIRTQTASMMTGPWGRQLAYRLIGEHRDMSSFQTAKPYWSYQHHTNGLIAVQALIDQTMKGEIFAKIDMPVYCGYYYKNEEEQDPVVSVEAIKEFQKNLTIQKDKVEFEAFETGNHVLGSIYKNEDWIQVQNEILDFINNKL